MSGAYNISGQVYALTVLTPILDGHETELAEYLDTLPAGEQSPLARVPGTHFARWVIIGDVVYEGLEQEESATTSSSRAYCSRVTSMVSSSRICKRCAWD